MGKPEQEGALERGPRREESSSSTRDPGKRSRGNRHKTPRGGEG